MSDRQGSYIKIFHCNQSENIDDIAYGLVQGKSKIYYIKRTITASAIKLRVFICLYIHIYL